MRAQRSLALSVAVGWAAGVTLYALMAATYSYAPKDASWAPMLVTLLVAFATVGPGVVAGHFAARSGILTGGVAGALTSAVNSVFVSQIDTRSIMAIAELPQLIVPQEIALAVGAFIVSGICGLAGVKIATDAARSQET